MSVPPTVAVVGDTIEHELMRGFPMKVEAVSPCESDWNRDTPHSKYAVTDPEGNTDELCAYDVVKVL